MLFKIAVQYCVFDELIVHESSGHVTEERAGFRYYGILTYRISIYIKVLLSIVHAMQHTTNDYFE